MGQEQDALIAQMGSTLQSIHADKNDPSKDDRYWQQFAVACERERAKRLGLVNDFDEALAKGELASIRHRIALATVIGESKAAQKVHFVGGLLAGVALTLLAWTVAG